MRKLTDCHIHSERCGHAVGTVDEYVRQAVAHGLVGIAITEHLALPEELDPTRQLSMPACDLEEYLVEVDFARERYPQLEIVTGLEADYLPDYVDRIARDLDVARARADGPRMVLGSVHFIGQWAFDDPTHVEEWENHDVDKTWGDYFELWCDAARTGLFDVMAHPDLVKKFGHRPSFDPSSLYAEAAGVAARAGVLIEVSTAGLRKPVGELYPGRALLAAFREAGVAATVGSDAHEPSEVGYRIDAAYDALAEVGYDSVAFPDGMGGWRELPL